jgi:HSP20 family protein
MVLRWDPFRELDRLTERPRPLMAMDAYRDAERVIVHLDVPGVSAEDVEITVERNELRVTVDREWDDGEVQMLLQERPQGSFSRTLYLSDGLDLEQVEASLDDGVLTIGVPLAERSRPRQVSVGSGQHKSQPIETSSRVAGAEERSDADTGSAQG